MAASSPSIISENEYYPGLPYPACRLVRFHEAAGIFTILLSDDRIIHFEPEHRTVFRAWLKVHGIDVVE